MYIINKTILLALDYSISYVVVINLLISIDAIYTPVTVKYKNHVMKVLYSFYMQLMYIKNCYWPSQSYPAAILVEFKKA